MDQTTAKSRRAKRIDAMMMYDSSGLRAWLSHGDGSVCIDPGQNGSPVEAGGPGGTPGPVRLSQRWPDLPDLFVEGIDAMMMYNNSGLRAWLVRGDQSVCIDPGQTGKPTSAGGPGGKPGPLTLAQRWPALPEPFRTGIDAMMMYSDNGLRAWLVRGDQSVCIDPGQDGTPVNAGGPGGKPGPLTLAQRWPALPEPFRTGIDAMMMYSNNGLRAWLVRGDQSVCIDPGQDGSPVEAGGQGGQPGPVKVERRWPALPDF